MRHFRGLFLLTLTDGGQPRRIDVPVEVPEGVDRSRTYNDAGSPTGQFMTYTSQKVNQAGYIAQGFIGGTNKRARSGAGSGAGAGGGGAAPPPNAPPSVTFSGGVTSITAPLPAPSPVKSAEEQRIDRLRVKAHPTVLSVINRVREKNVPQIYNWAGFVREGRAEVQVWLHEKTDEARAKLKEMGFEVVLDPADSKLIIGRVPLEKLELLAEQQFVRYLAPQTSK